MCFDVLFRLSRKKKTLHYNLLHLELIHHLHLLHEEMREEDQKLNCRHLLELVPLFHLKDETRDIRKVDQELHQEKWKAGKGDHHTECGLALRQGTGEIPSPDREVYKLI